MVADWNIGYRIEVSFKGNFISLLVLDTAVIIQVHVEFLWTEAESWSHDRSEVNLIVA